MIVSKLTVTIAKRTPHREEHAVFREFLNPVVAGLRNLEVSRWSDADAVRVQELSRSGAHGAPSC